MNRLDNEVIYELANTFSSLVFYGDKYKDKLQSIADQLGFHPHNHAIFYHAISSDVNITSAQLMYFELTAYLDSVKP